MRKKLDAKKYTVTYEIKTEVTEGSTSPHARRHYSWQRITQRVAQVYAQTIADNAHAPHPSRQRSRRKRSRIDP